MASYLGWTLDAFDFFTLVFVRKDVAQEFHTGVETLAYAIFLTLAARPTGALQVWPRRQQEGEASIGSGAKPKPEIAKGRRPGNRKMRNLNRNGAKTNVVLQAFISYTGLVHSHAIWRDLSPPLKFWAWAKASLTQAITL